MDPVSSASPITPTSAPQGSLQAETGISVMKKAAHLQADAVATLLGGLPQAPALATSGSLGTRLNTYA